MSDYLSLKPNPISAGVIPKFYNAALDLLSRHATRSDKSAYIDATTGATLSYGQLEDQAYRFAQGLREAGFQQEQRVLLCMHDGLLWPVVFLGCILVGVVPVAVNTLLTTKDYEFMLQDSRAHGLVVSEALWPQFAVILHSAPACKQVFIDSDVPLGHAKSISQMIQASQRLTQTATTLADEVCFWLYSSGSTGSPKGTLHLHSHIIETAQLYGHGVLGLKENDGQTAQDEFVMAPPVKWCPAMSCVWSMTREAPAQWVSWANCKFRAPPPPSCTGTTAKKPSTPLRESGRAAVTNTAATKTATTLTAVAATIC